MIKRRRLRAVTGLALAVVAAAACAGLATAHYQKLKVQLSASYVDLEPTMPRADDPIDYFSGQITQRYLKPNCTRRLVRVSGPSGDPKFATIGEVLSDTQGNWTLPAEDVAPGTYIVFLKKKALRTAPSHESKHFCAPRKLLIGVGS